MRPESELQAEEVAFVNTCEKHAALLGIHGRGRYEFELRVFDGGGNSVAAFNPERVPLVESESTTATPPLTIEEFDTIVRTGEAELPPIPEPPLVQGFPGLEVPDDLPKATTEEAFAAVGLPPPPMDEFGSTEPTLTDAVQSVVEESFPQSVPPPESRKGK